MGFQSRHEAIKLILTNKKPKACTIRHPTHCKDYVRHDWDRMTQTLQAMQRQFITYSYKQLSLQQHIYATGVFFKMTLVKCESACNMRDVCNRHRCITTSRSTWIVSFCYLCNIIFDWFDNIKTCHMTKHNTKIRF